jgi:hypothetical protein
MAWMAQNLAGLPFAGNAVYFFEQAGISSQQVRIVLLQFENA